MIGGHEPERPLRADHPTRQVIPRPVLHLAAEPDELPRPGHRLQPEHVVHRGPVLEAVRAAGVGRAVPADRRHHLARGVGREVVAVLARGLAQPEVDQARLHDGAPVREVQLEDAVHPVHRDHHAAGGRHRAPDEARARSARDHGHLLAPAQPHDLRGLLGRLGKHHHVGLALVEGVHVGFVGEPPFGRRHDPAGSHDALQLADEGQHSDPRDPRAANGRCRARGPSHATRLGGGGFGRGPEPPSELYLICQVSPDCSSFAMSPAPRLEIAFCSWWIRICS